MVDDLRFDADLACYLCGVVALFGSLIHYPIVAQSHLVVRSPAFGNLRLPKPGDS